MSVEDFMDSVGREWRDLPPMPELRARKFLERERTLRQAWGIVHEHLPEYLGKRRLSAVDFSCANGSLLEALRYHRLEVLGVDVQYFEFLESQQIPYLKHDCRTLPYPLATDSHDIVSCVGAITFYGQADWTEVLDEFGRIARRCILVAPNTGHILDANRHKLNEWCPPGWSRDKSGPSWWKWTWRPRE